MLLLSACRGDDPQHGSWPVGREISDSTGIRIVVEPASAKDLPVAAVVSEQPEFVLGADEAAAHQLFSTVGPVVFADDGTLLVVDEGTREIRVHDRNGRLVRTLGRSGEGPGEFGGIDAMTFHDRLIAWDGGLDRVTELALDGEVLATYPVRISSGGWPARVAFLESGAFVFGQNLLDDGPKDTGVALRHDSVALFILHDEGSRVDTLGRFPGTESMNELRVLGGVLVVDVPRVPFGADFFVRAIGNRVLWAYSGPAEFRLFSVDGRLEEIWRFPGLSLGVTDSDLARFRSSPGVHGLVPSETQVEVWLDAFPPETLPAFDDLLVAQGGPIWIKSPRASDSEEWWIVTSIGEVAGRVVLPEGLELRAASEDRIAGVRRDALDVERVEVYELR